MVLVPVVVSLGLSALAPSSANSSSSKRPPSGQPPSLPVEVVTSEVLSLVYFARSAAGEARTSKRLKRVFEAHATDVHRQALADMAGALRAIPSGRRFYAELENPPRGRVTGADTTALLETRAALATDLDDFGRRILGMLPVGEHARLLAALQTLAPLHDVHVWQQERAALEANAAALRRRIDERDIPEQLGAIGRFYGARWPAGQPMIMALVPVPAGGRVLTAHSIGAVQVIEVPPDDDADARLGVVVHEACHSLYEAQPLELQRALSNAFQTHAPGLEGDLLLHQLNEGLATALGNAWTHARKHGQPPDRGWYNDPVVDAVARALYPEVSRRMANAETIDASFIDHAVRALREQLPTPAARPRLLFDSVLLLIDPAVDGSSLVNVLREHGGNHSAFTPSPPWSRHGVDSYTQGQGATPVLVVTPGSVGRLGDMPFAAALDAELQGLEPTEGGLARLTDLGDGRRKLVLLVRNHIQAEETLKALAKRDVLPLEAWFNPTAPEHEHQP